MPSSILPISHSNPHSPAPSIASTSVYGGGGGASGSGRGGLGYAGSGGSADAYGLSRSDRGLPIMLRRLTKFRSMDFELAFWQLTYLVVAPRRVYKQTYHHKQTKNIWARDDPAMLLLISACLVVAGTAWSLVHRQSLAGTLWVIVRMVLRDFLLFSLGIALVLYFLTNRLLLAPSAVPHATASDNRVELTYAFDVAVNSFFPAFLTVYIALLPLASVVTRNNWVCLFFGNTLFLIAGIQYVYVMYLGIAAMPFVARAEVLLAPLLPLFGGYLLSLLGFNIARHTLELYFGQSWR